MSAALFIFWQKRDRLETVTVYEMASVRAKIFLFGNLTWNKKIQSPSKFGIAEFAGLEFAGLEKDGLENDGVEQEERYILHTMKWTQTNVYDTLLFHAQIQIHILRVLFEGLGATMWSTAILYNTGTHNVVIVWFLFYHIFNKYNSKCGIIYVFRLMLETITCRIH